MSPSIAWTERDLTTCITIWPPSRAGHGSAFDTQRNGIWIFGGYSTYYPYLKTDGEGSGLGVTQENKGGFIPYPGFSYYKSDLWFYNISSGYWTEHSFDSTTMHAWPGGRTDMLFLLLGDVLFMDGGYADNFCTRTLGTITLRQGSGWKRPSSCTQSTPTAAPMTWTTSQNTAASSCCGPSTWKERRTTPSPSFPTAPKTTTGLTVRMVHTMVSSPGATRTTPTR